MSISKEPAILKPNLELKGLATDGSPDRVTKSADSDSGFGESSTFSSSAAASPTQSPKRGRPQSLLITGNASKAAAPKTPGFGKDYKSWMIDAETDTDSDQDDGIGGSDDASSLMMASMRASSNGNSNNRGGGTATGKQQIAADPLASPEFPESSLLQTPPTSDRTQGRSEDVLRAFPSSSSSSVSSFKNKIEIETESIGANKSSTNTGMGMSMGGDNTSMGTGMDRDSISSVRSNRENEEEIKKLRTQLQERDDELKRKESQVRDHEAKLREKENQIQEKETKIRRLEDDNRNMLVSQNRKIQVPKFSQAFILVNKVFIDRSCQ